MNPNKRFSRDEFPELLRNAATKELDYWKRKNNFSDEAFFQMLPYLNSKNIKKFEWKMRKSHSGKHGEDGEDYVFCVTFRLYKMGISKDYYMKGYFFTKKSRDGVTIQSFREDNHELIV